MINVVWELYVYAEWKMKKIRARLRKLCPEPESVQIERYPKLFRITVKKSFAKSVKEEVKEHFYEALKNISQEFKEVDHP